MTDSKNKLLLMSRLPERPEPLWKMMAALNGNNFWSKEYKLPPHNADAIAACIIHVSLKKIFQNII